MRAIFARRSYRCLYCSSAHSSSSGRQAGITKRDALSDYGVYVGASIEVYSIYAQYGT